MAKKTHKIVCTQSQQVNIDIYSKDKMGNNNIVRRLSIGGGANVWDGVRMPSGTGILVDDEEIELIRANPVFKAFETSGFATVVRINENQDRVIESLTEKDKSAQRTPSDLIGKNVNVINNKGEIVVEMPEQQIEEESPIVVSVKKGKKSAKTAKSKK